MFKKKTVFILGAGASWHYGYPTGEELVQRVKEKAAALMEINSEGYRAHPNRNGAYFQDNIATASTPITGECPFIKTVGDVLNLARKLHDKILMTNPLVIDDFLGRNKSISDFGKMLIAMVLHDCEARPEFSSKCDWVRYLAHQLMLDCEKPADLQANQVTFVTFNYDLSLEKRLDGIFDHYDWLVDTGISTLMTQEPRIFHVYGKLRKYEETDPVGRSGEYDDQFDWANKINRAWDAAQNIRTIMPEKLISDSEENKTIETIKMKIAEAEYLYFLGYGFDRRNNELLGIGTRPPRSSRQFIRFTNYHNLNKTSKYFARSFHLKEEALIGEKYIANTQASGNSEYDYLCEKSIKSVYDALAQDFDWPPDA